MNREQPEQRDDNGDHRREDRPADEEIPRLRGLRWALRVRRVLDSVHHFTWPADMTVAESTAGTGLTTRPGATFHRVRSCGISSTRCARQP